MSDALAAVSDADLAVLARSGHEMAFAALFARHRARVYRLILNNVADADEALDLVQETFLSAHRALGRYDPARPMAGWLATIALNKCRDWSRRRTVRRWLWRARPIEEVADTLGDGAPGQDIAIADRDRLTRLRAAIADLPATLREPLVLCAIEGASHGEAAAILGVSAKAVETRLRRARLRLGEMLPE
ncbi:hypothetical protein ASG37_01860 [Sphingomonas sp. Leaf407]|uniref:RNA polymerase sigma factor n=1 Tax=unclassified Sphingomonas TaxID=196159 RepID=UPI0006F2A35A|nr:MULTISPECIES: RNA polymerase sigma factor [unclassified Sphingomonas]KQN40560.1 hypothetical protein ASE97_01885 [Sphingomonas sp. Leaf42]KQT29915.1 hypothetical protein ASG37_01860 [Sphingomonas sp. Leaf407]